MDEASGVPVQCAEIYLSPEPVRIRTPLFDGVERLTINSGNWVDTDVATRGLLSEVAAIRKQVTT